MKKLFIFYIGLFTLLLISCKGTDEEPQVDCPSDMNLGRVDLEDNSVVFISQEMRDSTMIIFVDENDKEMVFHVSDGNMGQEYIKLLEQKNKTVSCGSETVNVQLIPQEFFMMIESEDGRSVITWKMTVETGYEASSNSVVLTDFLNVTASGNVDGNILFVNDKSNEFEGLKTTTGAFYTEIRIHGVPFKDVYLDKAAVNGSIDDANLVINQDYGIAAFKDRLGFWWRHKDFR